MGKGGIAAICFSTDAHKKGDKCSSRDWQHCYIHGGYGYLQFNSKFQGWGHYAMKQRGCCQTVDRVREQQISGTSSQMKLLNRFLHLVQHRPEELTNIPTVAAN